MYEGPHTVAAVILETVTGTNGIIVPPDGYLQSIREVCDRHGILLIADEVMAGFGRTGKWFAVDNWDVVPDIITLAKGINSGYVPLGAMVVSRADRRLGAPALLRRRSHLLRPSACLCLGGRLDRGLPRGRHRRERCRDRQGARPSSSPGLPRGIRRSARCGGSVASSGSNSSRTARRASRSCRSTRRGRR